MMLKYLCLDFYSLRDKFDIHGDDVHLQNENRSASFNVDKEASDFSSNGTLFGRLEVGSFDEGILEYRWTLQLMRWSTFTALAVGLASNRKCVNGHFCDSATSDRDPPPIGLEFDNWCRAKKHANPSSITWVMPPAYDRSSSFL